MAKKRKSTARVAVLKMKPVKASGAAKGRGTEAVKLKPGNQGQGQGKG